MTFDESKFNPSYVSQCFYFFLHNLSFYLIFVQLNFFHLLLMFFNRGGTLHFVY